MRLRLFAAATAMLAFTFTAHADSITNVGNLNNYKESGEVIVLGSNLAIFPAVRSEGTLRNTFSDTAGDLITLYFTLLSDGLRPNNFSTTVDGTTLFSQRNIAAGTYNEHVTFTATGSDTIAFIGRNDPGFLYLTNVSATQLAATPEPSSLALLGTGILGVIGAARRRLA